MRFDIEEIRSVNNKQDIVDLSTLNSNALMGLIRYAKRLFNEASLILSQIAQIERRNEGIYDEDLIQAKETFELQQAESRRFLHFCKEAGVIVECKRAKSKSALKNIVGEMYHN